MTIDTKRLKTDAAYWDELKAPEDATHACIYSGGKWQWMRVNLSGPFNYYWHKRFSEWRRQGSEVGERIIPRPTKPAAPEWDEAGDFPPVGERVDACVYGDWQELVVCGYGNRFCIGINEDGEDIVFEFNDSTFRPIRTKEQRQRDELTRLVTARGKAEEVADAIIAAGWRKDA